MVNRTGQATNMRWVLSSMNGSAGIGPFGALSLRLPSSIYLCLLLPYIRKFLVFHQQLSKSYSKLLPRTLNSVLKMSKLLLSRWSMLANYQPPHPTLFLRVTELCHTSSGVAPRYPAHLSSFGETPSGHKHEGR